MAKATVTIDFASHYSDWDKFRRQPAVANALQQMGERIANQADANARSYINSLRREGFVEPEHGVDVTMGSKRARCTVWTKNYPARLAQARSNSLLNALHAGAGYF